MDIQHKSNESKGVFFVEVDGDVAAEMAYNWAGEEKIIIDHTEVKDSLRGKGVGKKLLLEVVDFARNKNIKILPLCPFAKSVFDKDSSLRDVL